MFVSTAGITRDAELFEAQGKVLRPLFGVRAKWRWFAVENTAPPGGRRVVGWMLRNLDGWSERARGVGWPPSPQSWGSVGGRRGWKVAATGGGSDGDRTTVGGAAVAGEAAPHLHPLGEKD